MQEFLGGRDQIGGAPADQLRVGDQHHRIGGQHVDQQFHPVDQGRGQRLHAVCADALGDPVEHVGQLGVVGDQRFGTGPDLRGHQQFTAGRADHLLDLVVGGALVGDHEVAQVIDRVTEEVDPDRVFLGGGEDVDDATPDGELAASLHHVDRQVGGCDEGRRDLVDAVLLAPPQPDRRDVGQACHLRLEQGAHRGDDDPRGRPVVLAGQSPQHLQASADGVGARAEPLVRQRLPGRVVGREVRPEQGLQGGELLLRLPIGGGDQQVRTLRPPNQLGGQEGPQGGRHGDVAGVQDAGTGVVHALGDGGLRAQQVEDAGQLARQVFCHRTTVARRTDTPRRRDPVRERAAAPSAASPTLSL